MAREVVLMADVHNAKGELVGRRGERMSLADAVRYGVGIDPSVKGEEPPPLVGRPEQEGE
jgi:hypothetical protein